MTSEDKDRAAAKAKNYGNADKWEYTAGDMRTAFIDGRESLRAEYAERERGLVEVLEFIARDDFDCFAGPNKTARVAMSHMAREALAKYRGTK